MSIKNFNVVFFHCVLKLMLAKKLYDKCSRQTIINPIIFLHHRVEINPSSFSIIHNMSILNTVAVLTNQSKTAKIFLNRFNIKVLNKVEPNFSYLNS